MTYSFSITTAASALALSVTPAWAKELKIVASFSILGDMVEQVAGEFASITIIVGPDADAHLYQPNFADQRSDLRSKRHRHTFC